MLANMTCSLIEHKRIRTTLAKAKALRPYAEKMVTLGKRGDLHARRLAVGYLQQQDAVRKLFDDIAVACKDRQGGYTRITKLGQRRSDSAPMAFIEWVDGYSPVSEEPEVIEPAAEEVTTEEAAPKKKRATKKKAAAKDAVEA